MPRTSPVGNRWIFEFGVPNTETDELLQVGCRGSWALLYFPPFITQVHTPKCEVAVIWFFPSQLSASTGLNMYKGFVGHPRARAPNTCFHCSPDPRGMPVSSLSLSLGQQEAGSCYTTVNNTINSPWLINWLQTNPAASLCTLLCVTSLSCLSSSHVMYRSAAVL